MKTETTGETVAVILAAGKNKRMLSSLPKSMHRVGGTPMIGMVYESVRRSGIKRCIVVVADGSDEIRQYLGGKAEYACQKEQLGTGHALQTALDYLDAAAARRHNEAPTASGRRLEAAAQKIEDTETFPARPETAVAEDCPVGAFYGRLLVAYGDMPFVSADTFKSLTQGSAKAGEAGALVYADLPEPNKYGYGRIIRDAGGNFVKIVEQRDATEEEAQIRESNVGVYCFDAAAVREALVKVRPDNAQGEIYLTDVFAPMLEAGGRVGLHKATDNIECAGANDRAALAELNRIARIKKCRELMLDSGVTLVDPESAYIDGSVSVGADTVVYPGCVIEGATIIGSGCEIGPNATIRDSRVGDGAKIINSVVSGATIGDGAVVGPYAHVTGGFTNATA